MLVATGCGKEDEGTGWKPSIGDNNGDKQDPVIVPIDTPSDFFVPNKVYNDNYSGYAGWADHAKWNLANVHDPSICYYNGKYYMWCTDASYGNEHLKSPSGRHFPGKYSEDLVTWSYCPGPFNETPSWCAEKLNEIRKNMGLDPIASKDIVWGWWAPVVRVVDGKIRMYYSIVVDNYIKSGKANIPENADGSWTERAFIGMCETTNPEGGPSAWVDHGFVTCSSSDLGKDNWNHKSGKSYWDGYFYYNAIDPTYIVTPEGKHYLIHGSWHSGFTLLEIDGATGKPVKPLDDVNPWADNASALQENFGKRISTRGISRWQASEAPEIMYKDGYYYLFMAWDGLDVPYNTRVVRAENIEGPYYTSRGADFSAGAEGTKVYPIVTHPYRFKDSYGWVGIAHCCVFQKEDTKEWMYCSQQRFPVAISGINASNALMMGGVRKLVWCPATGEDLDDLWPIALPERYAAVEKDEMGKKPLTEEDIMGAYEFINMGYKVPHERELANGAKEKYYNDGEIDAEENLLYFNADHTYSLEGQDDMQGTWEFDAEKKYIKLTSNTGKFTGSGNKLETMILCAERELDWEKGKISVVFAGFHKNNTCTYWGKKVANLSK